MAVKKLKHGTRRQVEEFRNEVRVLARLRHPVRACVGGEGRGGEGAWRGEGRVAPSSHSPPFSPQRHLRTLRPSTAWRPPPTGSSSRSSCTDRSTASCTPSRPPCPARFRCASPRCERTLPRHVRVVTPHTHAHGQPPLYPLSPFPCAHTHVNRASNQTHTHAHEHTQNTNYTPRNHQDTHTHTRIPSSSIPTTHRTSPAGPPTSTGWTRPLSTGT